MASIEIYTRPMCPFCWHAKHLLDSKNIAYQEINIWTGAGRRQEMIERAEGRSTVPQIFINGEGIGGSDELAALEEAGKLDAMLEQA